jgi:hypothetical protein
MNTPVENRKKFFPEKEKDDESGHAHRQLVGSVGLLLPPLLWLIAGLRPLDIQIPWQPLGSVSAYYYTGAVSIFSGALIAMAIFLFSYKGYKNEYYKRDRLAAFIAGIAAVLVALFPTHAPEGYPVLPWWSPLTGVVHYAAAIILFSSFIFFAFFQFPRSKVTNLDEMPADKKFRNWIYKTCAGAMLACIIWAGVSLINQAPIFWPETLALEFFAISWLVKGRLDQTAVAASKQTMQYVKDPRQLVEDMKNVIGE